MDSRKNHFTLIELMIVISVIAILVALLLPALHSAREKGRTTLCLSNQKQNFLALAQYANDFGWYPAAKGSQAEIDDFNQGYWYMKLLPYLGFKRKFSGATGWTNVGIARVWKSLNCPNLERIHKIDTAAFALNGFRNAEDIGLRGIVSRTPGNKNQAHYIRADASFSNRRPISKLALSGDMNCNKTTGSTNPEIENGQLFDDSQPGFTISMRHANRKNILFMDGTITTWGKAQMGNSLELLRYKLYYENR